MVIAASSLRPTFASHLGDSHAKRVIMRIMPAKIMCMIVASTHWLEEEFDMWIDVPQFAKYPSIMPK
jgi:hypothetical protein